MWPVCLEFCCSEKIQRILNQSLFGNLTSEHSFGRFRVNEQSVIWSFFFFMWCSRPLHPWPKLRSHISAQIHSVSVKMSFHFVCVSQQTCFQPLSLPHSSGETLPPPRHSVHPLTSRPPHPTRGVHAFISFVSERLFRLRRPLEGWNRGTLELPR